MTDYKQKHFDLREHPEMIDEINRLINGRFIVEMKEETMGVTIVQVLRTKTYPMTDYRKRK